MSHVDVGQVSQSFEMTDAKLRRGDVLLMDAFTWHDAWPNKSDRHRLGLYLKFHAADTPGATGPVLFAPTAQALLGDHGASYKMPFVHSHQVSYRPLTTSIASVGLVLEDDTDRILLCVHRATDSSSSSSTGGGGGSSSGGGGDSNSDGRQQTRRFSLPKCEAVVDTGAELDAENLIGCITDHIALSYGVEVPWMSWLFDGPEADAATLDASGGRPKAGSARRQICRYYAHRSAPTRPAS